jgi:hypothetical protein
MPDEESVGSDPCSSVVIALTLVLFLVSISVKGFTHELLLEAGVFMVSIKLILMAHKNSLAVALPAGVSSISRDCWKDFKARQRRRENDFCLGRKRCRIGATRNPKLETGFPFPRRRPQLNTPHPARNIKAQVDR